MLQPRQAFFAPTAIPQSLPLEWRTPSSLPPGGSAVLNDRPVACQIRGPTRRETGAPISRRRQPPPTHCGASRRNGRDLIIAKNDQRTSPYPRCCQRQRRRGYFAPRARERVSDGSLLSTATKVTKSAGRNCVSALPQRAMPVRCRPRFPSRNRRFPDRCRSPDCASTAFRCRCLLLRQKLFVLPRRRLRNNYILCPTGTPTHCGAPHRNGRDLIIAKTVQRTRSYSRTASAAAAQEVQAIPRIDNDPRRANSAKPAPPNSHLPAPRQGILKP